VLHVACGRWAAFAWPQLNGGVGRAGGIALMGIGVPYLSAVLFLKFLPPVQPRPGEASRAAEGGGLAQTASGLSEIEPADRLLKSEEGLTPKSRQARHTTPREVRPALQELCCGLRQVGPAGLCAAGLLADNQWR